VTVGCILHPACRQQGILRNSRQQGILRDSRHDPSGHYHPPPGPETTVHTSTLVVGGGRLPAELQWLSESSHRWVPSARSALARSAPPRLRASARGGKMGLERSMSHFPRETNVYPPARYARPIPAARYARHSRAIPACGVRRAATRRTSSHRRYVTKRFHCSSGYRQRIREKQCDLFMGVRNS
jgi:hypothetical protein